MAKLFAICALLGGLFLLASCGGEREPKISLSDGWARETAPGQSAAAVYLTIANQGDGVDRLVGVGSTAAASASVHESSSKDGIARMRALSDGAEIKSRASLALEPGGTHIMLVGLTQRLTAGETVNITLKFARSRSLDIPIHVEPATFAPGSSR